MYVTIHFTQVGTFFNNYRYLTMKKLFYDSQSLNMKYIFSRSRSKKVWQPLIYNDRNNYLKLFTIISSVDNLNIFNTTLNIYIYILCFKLKTI